ncbi:MAG: hypothetical protein BJBARM5_0534 [Candidatus Parvarchaeum acidophilus ARMAN-5]|jgi:hypothetical protein|uniref:Uncharacterized protein n=1 Tax=Candidatus Parvarchaeum acidophilus ARMAN-5 TaxID=662762 RepID=D6GVM1_PARA5|nr:MAG: hypothetical protein BJBARM5_0534 [Candidatus Parvarchaeum acidophilus ARMAN-5]
MEEIEVAFVKDRKVTEKKGFKAFSDRLRFETVNLELFICTVLASVLESFAENKLTFTVSGLSFFMLSIFVNILLIEAVFRFMKVVKNGKIGKS